MTNLFTDTNPAADDLAEGGTWLLDLVAAVDHLRRGYRPNLTVWDALGEALDQHLNGEQDRRQPPTAERDPLRAALAQLVFGGDDATAAQLQAATRRWATTMADRYNEGHHWPHPHPRRGFPPPTLDMR